MATLKTQDHRFMVSPDGWDAAWVHPVEVATRCPDWTDCTDMDDAEFDLFVAERMSANPKLAA